MTTKKWVGQPIERKEDRALLLGRGQFVDDLKLPGMGHVALLRSPYAHARILRVNERPALELPGVFATLTGTEVARMTRPQKGRIPLPMTLKVYSLAYEKALYVGQPVVAVAAVDRATAEDALDLIEVEYEPLTAVVDPEDAMKTGAPLLFEEVGTNVLWHNTFPYGDVEGAFASADQIVRERIRIHRYASTPLETFGAIAQYEPAAATFTIWGHTQQPAQDLHVVAAALGISPGDIRLIVPQMGGSFGNKVRPLYLITMALLARKAGRPVKWIEDRRESLMGLGQAADGIMDVEAAVKNDGKILALKFRNVENEGAGLDFAGRHNLLMLSNMINCYRIPAVSYEGYSVLTNCCPVVANRGIGKPFMCFTVERMVDTIAKALKLDRIEVRFRNFIQPEEFPYDTPSGQRYDSGNYPELLRKGLALIGYERFQQEKLKAREAGRLLGLGIAVGVEPGGSNLSYGMLISGPNQLLSGQGEAVRIRLETDGTATVYTGGLDSGQGHGTCLTQIIADELGLPMEAIRVAATFDTSSHPFVMTSGVYSNKFHSNDAPAAIHAARRLREKILRRAAKLLEANDDDLELGNGRVWVRGVPEKGVSIADVASRAYWSLANLQPGEEPGLEGTYYYSNPLANTPDEQKRVRVQLGFAGAAHVALVEVDPETFECKVLRYGVVHDCGRQINPLIVQGQIHGATVHGIAAALLEEFVYDADGQLLTTSFMDYLKPTSADVPNIEGDHLETPSPLTPLGTKGIGEGGAVIAPAAIASAVEDALEPLGIRITGLPITPSRLWEVARAKAERYSR